MMISLRRGSALILVLIMTLSLAGLAMSAIYMAGSSGLLSRYHDKERDLTFALETALELGKSRLQRDTTLVLYDTGYRQLLTSQAVYTSGGAALTGVTVDLYAGYTGDTSGVYVPYVTLLGTVSDPSGVRLARRMDFYSQSFSRYSLFANDFPSSSNIGAGENIPGRVHANNRFIGASSGTPYPVFMDTVSAAGTITGYGQWADTVSATGGARVIPYPAAATIRAYYQALASGASLSLTSTTGSGTRATSGCASSCVDISGMSPGVTSAIVGTRLEFLTVDVNNNGAADSTEGFFRIFHLYPSSYFMGGGYEWVGGADTTRLAVNFSGTPVPLTTQIMLNQCGAFYTISGRREFFPVVMHKVTWVKTRIQSSTYPTVSSGQADDMAKLDRDAIRKIAQQPTARCFPQGSPYLVNTERFTINTNCAQDWSTSPYTTYLRYTFGSSAICAALSRQYGGQDTTFTQYSFTCPVDQSDGAGRCTGGTAYIGYWDTYSGTNNLPGTLPAAVRQNVERQHLYPFHRTYNPNSRGVVYLSGRIFLSGTVRGRATLYVNGYVTLQDDLTYDADPADITNLCRNNFGLLARDSILVSDNALNRPRVYDAGAGRTLTLGGNRDFIFHGSAMALSGSFRAFNAGDATATDPVYTCPTGSSFTAAGGCMQVVGGSIMRTYAAPYTATTANSGLRPLRELDPCQLTNRRPPYFPIARTVVRPFKTFDVDVRQVKTTALLTAYFTRLRGNRAAP